MIARGAHVNYAGYCSSALEYAVDRSVQVTKTTNFILILLLL
jgi:hypothetical protein